MEVYNVQPAIVDIRVTKGDTFNISFRVDLNGVSYPLTGKKIDMTIKKIDGTAVKTLSSEGPGAAIAIIADSYNINTVGFAECDTLKYDVQLTEGIDILTIQKGKIIVEDEITTAV